MFHGQSQKQEQCDVKPQCASLLRDLQTPSDVTLNISSKYHGSLQSKKVYMAIQEWGWGMKLFRIRSVSDSVNHPVLNTGRHQQYYRPFCSLAVIANASGTVDITLPLCN